METLTALDVNARRLYDCYPSDGASISTRELMTRAAWLPEDRFKTLRHRLVVRGLVEIGTGRGGRNRRKLSQTELSAPSGRDLADDPVVPQVATAKLPNVVPTQTTPTKADNHRSVPVTATSCGEPSCAAEDTEEFAFLSLLTGFQTNLHALDLRLMRSHQSHSDGARRDLSSAILKLIEHINETRKAASHLVIRRSHYDA